MASDDEQAKPPDTDDVAEAYRNYKQSKSEYLETLARHVASRQEEADPIFDQFSQDAEVLRVLHAVSVGYGWSDAIYKVSTHAQVAQVQLRGFITRDELHDGLVLAQKGVEMLRRWTDYVVPLTETHARYRELWRIVTGLEG